MGRGVMRNRGETECREPGEGHHRTSEQERSDRAHVVHGTDQWRARGATERTDCLCRPRTVPCSFGSAYTDTSPVAAGAKTLFETASTKVQAYSSAELETNGTIAIVRAMP